MGAYEVHSRPVAWRQVSQWQKATPEKRSLSPLGATVCRAAPQWHETVMVLSAGSIVEIYSKGGLRRRVPRDTSSLIRLQTQTKAGHLGTWMQPGLVKGGQVGGEIILAPHLQDGVGPW